MRPIYLTAMLVLASGGGGVVYSAAPTKPDAASATQQQAKPDTASTTAQQPQSKPDRRAARTAAQKPYIGSTYVGTRSAAQGAGKPLKTGGAAFHETQQGAASRDATQATNNGDGERPVSPARGSLKSEQPTGSPSSPPRDARGGTPDTGAAEKPYADQKRAQQSGQQSGQQSAQQSAQQSSGQQSAQGANASGSEPGAGMSESAFDVKSTFRNICGFCHEDYGRHAGKGPQLMNSERSDEFMVNRIKNGMPGRMPGFGSTFNDAQIHQIVEFIRALKPGEEPKNPA